MTLTKDEIIDLMLLAEYLAIDHNFASFMVDLARKRIDQDRFDTQFMEVREVTCKLAKLVKRSTPSNFDIETAYYLCKHFKEKVVLRWGAMIKEQNFIKDAKLLNKLNAIIESDRLEQSLY